MVDTGEEQKGIDWRERERRIFYHVCNTLIAKDDVVARRELLNQREKYERFLHSYDVSSRLEPWYEYILWSEQNFLGDGHGGNMYWLLHKCLRSMAVDEDFLQDRRYIELWIRYIELSANPLEEYENCYTRGIAKYCALFYMSWAFELEKTGHFKRADQVFSLGLKKSSQPRDELEEAHKNFRLRVAGLVLKGSSDLEAASLAQRAVLSKLKAHGDKKNMVRHLQMRSIVQRRSAGVLQPVTHQGGNLNEVLSNQEGDIRAEISLLPNIQLVPRRKILNEENLLEPGPWNCELHNRKVTVLSRPQQPLFEVYQHEEVRIENSPLVERSALKPGMLDEVKEFKCPTPLFEPEDPSKRPMYCKKKVSAGETGISWRQLRVIEYLKDNRPAMCKQVYQHEEVQVENSTPAKRSALKPRKLAAEFKCSTPLFEPEDPSKRPTCCKEKVYAGETEISSRTLRATEHLKDNRPAMCKQVYQKDEVQVENSSLVNCSAVKPRKLGDDGFKCPIALFEPEDSSKRPMYCKNKVYADGTEFSFEELRAAEYLRGNRPARREQGRPGTKGDLTAAKLSGEKMIVSEAIEYEKRNTSLPLVQVTEKQDFNLCVDVEGEEDFGFGAVPHGDTENVATRVEEVVEKTSLPEVLLHFSDTESPHVTKRSYDQSLSHESLGCMSDLWNTPKCKKLQSNSESAGVSKKSMKKKLSFEVVDTQHLQTKQSRPKFEIFTDPSCVLEQGKDGASSAPRRAWTDEECKVS